METEKFNENLMQSPANTGIVDLQTTNNSNNSNQINVNVGAANSQQLAQVASNCIAEKSVKSGESLLLQQQRYNNNMKYIKIYNLDIH